MAGENGTMSGSAGWNAMNVIGGLLGVAGTATGITALGIKKGKNSNGCGSDGEYSDNCLVNRYEQKQAMRIAELESSSSTDTKLLSLYDKHVVDINRVEKQGFENATQIALNKQASDYQFAILDERIKNGDCDTKNWVLMQNYVKGEVILPISKICPQPLPACSPLSIQGNIVTTEPTDFSNTVVGKTVK